MVDTIQNQEPPEGWPRPPKFNPPGDVPGPPIQFGEPISPDTAQGGFGFIPNGIREKNIFFYHPDHLGSSSYITGQDGKVSQHTEYIAFGEILFDEHNTEHTMPYLFNGKELDQETGLYYYGARYYDPKVSIFVNVDPLVEKTMQPYAYANNNPVMLIDPTGMEGEDCPNCPKPSYNNQEFLASDKKIYTAIPTMDNSKKLEWVQTNNIEEVTLTKKQDNHLGQQISWGVDSSLSLAETSNSTFRLTNGTYNGNSFSPKLYTSGWKGGSRAKITTYNVSKIAKGAGYFTFGLSTLMDIYGIYKYNESPNSENAVHPTEAGFNFGVGLYSLRINPAVGLYIFGVSAFYPGGWFGDEKNPGVIMDQSRMIEDTQKIIPDFNLYKDRYGKW